jgi:regulator of sigma E protease
MAVSHPTPLSQVTDSAALIFKTLHGLFSKGSDISAKHLMGPVGLIKTLYSSAKGNFSHLLWLVILINVNLAILNLLPFPVLDGGIIATAALEKITGMRCIGKVFSKIQMLFLIMLIALMAYATFFDIRRIRMEDRQIFEVQRDGRLLISYDGNDR